MLIGFLEGAGEVASAKEGANEKASKYVSAILYKENCHTQSNARRSESYFLKYKIEPVTLSLSTSVCGNSSLND